MENTFITPEGHKGFLAKKLFDDMGKIHWGAIAYIEKTAAARKIITPTAITIFSSSSMVKCASSPAMKRSLPAKTSRYLWTA